MSISDYEIMGGVGYGSDWVSMNTIKDIKSLILNEQPVPTIERQWKPQSFAAGVGTELPTFYNPYLPIKQEPMGRNYTPDQFGSSQPLGLATQNWYNYPDWNSNNSQDSITNANSLAVEDYFQRDTTRYGDQVSINNFTPMSTRLNAYDALSTSLGGIKEKMSDSIQDAIVIANSNYNILIILLFIVFIIVSYLQHRQILKLQKIIGRVLTPKHK